MWTPSANNDRTGEAGSSSVGHSHKIGYKGTHRRVPVKPLKAVPSTPPPPHQLSVPPSPPPTPHRLPVPAARPRAYCRVSAIQGLIYFLVCFETEYLESEVFGLCFFFFFYYLVQVSVRPDCHLCVWHDRFKRIHQRPVVLFRHPAQCASTLPWCLQTWREKLHSAPLGALRKYTDTCTDTQLMGAMQT